MPKPPFNMPSATISTHSARLKPRCPNSLASLLNPEKALVSNDERWRFERVDRLAFPAMDKEADMVSFFSVFTHLLHEWTFLYFEAAKRVLKPGGKIVFGFLEFRMESHWPVFDSTVRDAHRKRPSAQRVLRTRRDFGVGENARDENRTISRWHSQLRPNPGSPGSRFGGSRSRHQQTRPVYLRFNALSRNPGCFLAHEEAIADGKSDERHDCRREANPVCIEREYLR